MKIITTLLTGAVLPFGLMNAAPPATAAPSGAPHIKVVNALQSQSTMPQGFAYGELHGWKVNGYLVQEGESKLVYYPSLLTIEFPKQVGSYRYKYAPDNKYGKCHTKKILNPRDTAVYLKFYTYPKKDCSF